MFVSGEPARHTNEQVDQRTQPVCARRVEEVRR